ncbi:MAG: hypothetical protein R3B46_01865 [Phycisphaerales bacterium]|nr:hypothetical protein [Phycisphaerales bacterium]
MTQQRDLLAKYTKRSVPETPGAGPIPREQLIGPDGEPHVQRERHQIMLTLETRDGVSTAMAYSYLSTIRCDPRGVIELDFAGSTVAIRGVNLKPLFDGLRTHTTATISESRGTAPREQSEPFVESIMMDRASRDDPMG